MSALEEMLSSSSLETDPPLRFISHMTGSARSVLVRDYHDRLWILKTNCKPQGPNALANEFIGAALCRLIGIPVPDFCVAKVDERFCNEKSVWLNAPPGVTAIAPGLHFASRYLPDQTGRACIESLPTALQNSVSNSYHCLGMFLFDVWAMHADNRQALFTCVGSGLKATFFDNGHLFGGPKGKHTQIIIDAGFLQKLALIQAHEGRKEQWISHLQDSLPKALDEALHHTPKEWLGEAFRPLPRLLLQRLEHLRTFADLAFAAIQHLLDARGFAGSAIYNRHSQVLLTCGNGFSMPR